MLLGLLRAAGVNCPMVKWSNKSVPLRKVPLKGDLEGLPAWGSQYPFGLSRTAIDDR